MWVNHDMCICEKCKFYKNGCKEQRIMEDTQKLLAHIKPDDVLVKIFSKNPDLCNLEFVSEGKGDQRYDHS